jgi:hypothetical protein
MPTKQKLEQVKQKRINQLERLLPKYQHGKMTFAQMFEEMKHMPVSYLRRFE